MLDECRLAFDHLLRDAGEYGDARADVTVGVDELLILGDDFPAFDTHDAQFYHSVAIICRGAGGFGIDEGEGYVSERLKQGNCHV